MKFVLFVMLFCLAFSTIECKGLRNKDITVNVEPGKDTAVKAKQGEKVNLVFKSSGASGDKWNLVSKGMKTVKLDGTSTSTVSDNGASGIAATFTFSTIAKGSEVLEFTDGKQKASIKLDVK